MNQHVIFRTHDTDPSVLTVEQLPTRPSLLCCASCGAPRARHTSRGVNACPQFVRPALPAGHAYIDTVAVGSVVGLRDSTGTVRERVEQVRATHPSAPPVAGYLAASTTRPSTNLDVATTTRRVTGDTIVTL